MPPGNTCTGRLAGPPIVGHLAARVVYTDSDPVVLVHGQALLAGVPSVRVVTADVRRPAEILDSAEVREFIDFGRPVTLLMLAIVHHLSDEEAPAGIVARFREAAAPGSYLKTP